MYRFIYFSRSLLRVFWQEFNTNFGEQRTTLILPPNQIMDIFSDDLAYRGLVAPRFDDEVDGGVIKGAIDYVLLPLLILGVSGPIFVVMYIIMSYVEFRLPPNSQGGRGHDSGAWSEDVLATVINVIRGL